MLRNDGTFTFYRIQHLQNDGKWVYSSFDHFGTPEGYKSSNDCWQEIGVHGCYDRNTAIEGLQWIRIRNVAETFRLVRIYILQETKVASLEKRYVDERRKKYWGNKPV